MDSSKTEGQAEKPLTGRTAWDLLSNIAGPKFVFFVLVLIAAFLVAILFLQRTCEIGAVDFLGLKISPPSRCSQHGAGSAHQEQTKSVTASTSGEAPPPASSLRVVPPSPAVTVAAPALAQTTPAPAATTPSSAMAGGDPVAPASVREPDLPASRSAPNSASRDSAIALAPAEAPMTITPKASPSAKPNLEKPKAAAASHRDDSNEYENRDNTDIRYTVARKIVEIIDPRGEPHVCSQPLVLHATYTYRRDFHESGEAQRLLADCAESDRQVGIELERAIEVWRASRVDAAKVMESPNRSALEGALKTCVLRKMQSRVGGKAKYENVSGLAGTHTISSLYPICIAKGTGNPDPTKDHRPAPVLARR